MTAVKVKFDGQQIEVPAELRAASPREVLLVFEEPRQSAAAHVPPSVWDAFGKASQTHSAAELNARLQADRDEWDAR